MMPLAVPTELCFPGYDLLVAPRLPDGTWDWDWQASLFPARLRVDSCSVGLNKDFPRAELSIDLSPDALNGVVIEPAIGMGDLYSNLTLNQEIVIFAESDQGRRFLFHGMIAMDTLKFDQNGIDANVTCISRLEWVAKQKQAWIIGRYMYDRSASGEDDKHKIVRALPCIFNAHGRPNRHPDLITVGEHTNVPVFSDDDASGAVFWKFADIIKYLHVFYWSQLPDTPDPGIGLHQIVEMVSSTVQANNDPLDAEPASAFTFGEVIKCKADTLNVNGMTVVKALQAWCEASGCSMHQYTLPDETGWLPDTQVLFALNREGGAYADYAESGESRTLRTSPETVVPEPRAFALSADGTKLKNLVPVDAHSGNEVVAGELMRDGNNVITSCRVFDGPELFEVTIGKQTGATNSRDIFFPGWKPDTTFGDNLSGTELTSAITALKAAKNGEGASGTAGTMAKRYLTSGSEFQSYIQVGRLWVLNESMELTGADYGRTNNGSTCWNDTAYNTKYDWSKLENTVTPGTPLKSLDDDGNRTVAWIPRRRRILPCVTRQPNGREFMPVLYCSWNSGTNWYSYPGNYRILEDCIGVYLSDHNLAEIKNRGKLSEDATSGRSVWEAIIRGEFRLAVTCGVESDEVVQGEYASTTALEDPDYHAVFQLNDVLRYEDCSSANSEVAELTGVTAENLDETGRAKAIAQLIVDSEQNRRYTGTIIIPRLSDKWRPGDIVTGIQPRGLEFTAADGAIGYPQIVKVTWVNSPNNQTTHVLIGDNRLDLRRVGRSAKRKFEGTKANIMLGARD